nr:MATE family efflux transporter [Lachnospiraceae bacterium]
MIMKKLIGTKDFYKKVLFIAIPIMIQNGITNFVSMLDNIMVGQIGTDQMSGVAIVNQLMFVFNICIFGGISGAGIFTAQFYGKGDQEGIRNTFRFKVYACGFLTAFAVALFWFADDFLISLYLHEGSEVGNLAMTLQCGKEYLAIMLAGLIPFAISQIYASTLRECGETILPMIAGVTAVFVNLGLNYVLIFGNFGAPKLGANGAAIATVISRFTEVGIVVIWTHAKKAKYKFIAGVYKSFRIPGELVRTILAKGSPLMANEILWAVGMAMIAQCYAYRGLAVVAAQNITSTIVNVFNIVYIALGSSVSIIIGQLLGAGKKEEAKEKDVQLIAFAVASCALIGAIMACFSKAFPSVYNTEQQVKNLATALILVSTLAMPFQAFNHASYFTLRSGGKTWITFLFDSVFVWVIVVPFAFCLSRFTSLGIVTVYLLVQATEIIKCIIGFIMVKSGIWLQNIVDEL